MNQYWLIFSEVLCHSPAGNFRKYSNHLAMIWIWKLLIYDHVISHGPNKESNRNPYLLTWIKLYPSMDTWFIHYKVWDKITHPFPNVHGSTVQVCEWINNFIPHFIMHAITYPWWELKLGKRATFFFLTTLHGYNMCIQHFTPWCLLIHTKLIL